MRNLIRHIGTIFIITTIIFTLKPVLAQEKIVNIYSYRQPDLIAPLLQEFSKQTGIKTKLLYLNKGLVERLKAEGANSPADIILTTDFSRLIALKNAHLLRKVTSEKINNNIPPQYRDEEGYWFGLTVRARVVFASKARVKQNDITYEELAEEKWRGKICSRSGQNIYNIGLFASMIAHHGVEKTKKWLKGLKANLARSPVGNDRAQIKAIYSGECDISLGNSYYAGLMRNNEEYPEQKQWEAAVKILFPNRDGRGTHVNLSGMGMAKYAPNPQNALLLMEFLASKKAQEIYAEQVYEYPVLRGAELSSTVKSFGQLKADKISLSTIAEYSAKASRLVDEVGFDD